MISDLIIKLDDVALSDYFDLIEEPDRGLFPGVEHTTVKMARTNGTRVTKRTLGDRTIKLSLIAFSGDFRKTKDELADVLFKEGKQKLWFSDEPDRYWLVELTGESSWKRELSSVSTSMGELSFLCEEGISHSMDTIKFPFKDSDTETTIHNRGTYETPIDINVDFTSDAKTIGFVSQENIVQLGTSYSEDEENITPSEKIMNDDMGTTTKKLWKENVGVPRWRFPDSGDNTSKVEGTLKWGETEVYPTDYGEADASKPGYWHGPTVSRSFTTPLLDFEAFHRFEFKPKGNSKEKIKCQGLMEINYLDEDNNFILGFEMKDNTDLADKVTYSFFIGTYRMLEVSLPKEMVTFHAGFFGSIMMSKVGNKFTFRLARIDGTNWKEVWSTTKSWRNSTVAMLSANTVNSYMAKWKNLPPMSTKLTHSRITKFNTSEEVLIPKTFYKGDNLLVEGKTNRVYLNGLRDDSYRVIGSSQALSAPKGESEIDVISDGTFTGNFEIKERYL